MTNSLISKLKKDWIWLGYFFIFSFAFVVFLYLLVPPGILCPDSFYHTKMALLIKEQGLIKDFPWTQFTTYKNLFVDHHFVYHLLLIPFLSIPSPENLDYFSLEIDPLIKAKVGTAFFAALAFLSIYWLCRRLKIKGSLIWALIGFLIPSFLLRLSLIRAPGISIIILILGSYFIVKKKYLGLFLLSLFYVWTYGAWPLILVAVFLYCLASAVKKTVDQWPKIQSQMSKIKNFGFYVVISRFTRSVFSKNNIKLVLSCITGLAAGLVINPYFPKTFSFYWLQTFKIALLNYQNKIGVGAEWYPSDLQTFFVTTLPILIPWIISLAWFVFKMKKQKTSSWFFAFISAFFLLYALKARRNIEYFVPFTILFSGIVFTQIIKKINWKNVKNHFKACFRGPENIFYFIISIFIITCVSVSLGLYLNLSVRNLYQEYQKNSRPLNHLQQASYWLKNHAQPKEIVFQSNWGIFPQLFYFNSQNYYINGLDQTFMYEYDKELYQNWLDLVSYRVSPEQTADILKEKFNASYVLADKNDDQFVKLLKKSKSLKEVYQDGQAIIYQINHVQ